MGGSDDDYLPRPDSESEVENPGFYSSSYLPPYGSSLPPEVVTSP